MTDYREETARYIDTLATEDERGFAHDFAQALFGGGDHPSSDHLPDDRAMVIRGELMAIHRAERDGVRVHSGIVMTAVTSYTLGQSLGDYAAKARWASTAATRAARRGFVESEARHRWHARRYAAICRAIREQFPRLLGEPSVYFDVVRHGLLG